MATTKRVEGKVQEMWGQKFEPALPYSIDAPQYDNAAEVRAAGIWPDEATITTMVNARVVAKKRAEAIKNTLKAAGVVKPGLENDAVAIAQTAKTLLARKKAATQEEAEKMAREILGIGDDDDDDVDA